MKRIVCLYGGPGTGKTTAMREIAGRGSREGLLVETVSEYVKNWVWEERPIHPGDQTYFFAKQSRAEREFIRNEIDLIVTDSPLLLTHFYGMKYDWMEQKYNTSLVMLAHHHGYCKEHGYKIDHFFIERTKPFRPKGRFQTEEQAKAFDGEIRDMLNRLGIKYHTLLDRDGLAEQVLSIVKTAARDDAQRGEAHEHP